MAKPSKCKTHGCGRDAIIAGFCKACYDRAREIEGYNNKLIDINYRTIDTVKGAR